MIRLRLTNESFEQDIRPLYKSFFPKEELCVSFGEEEPVGEFRYLLDGTWTEDGFKLSLFCNNELSKAVQKEEPVRIREFIELPYEKKKVMGIMSEKKIKSEFDKKQVVQQTIEKIGL